MTLKLPKRVRILSDRLYYQRDYPTSVRGYFPKKTFTYPLGLTTAEAMDDSKLSRAVLKAADAFDLELKMIQNSDPETFNASELDRAVIELLRKKGLKKGQFLKVASDPALAGREESLNIQLQPDAADFSDSALPEFDDVVDKFNQSQSLTFRDKVIHEAWQSLNVRAKAKPQTLSSLWEGYCQHRGIDIETRDGKRVHRRWQRWLAVCGDSQISNNTLNRIHDGLDSYVEARIEEGAVGASIKREMADIIACFNYSSRKHRFGWVIEPPTVPRSTPKQKAVMTQKEQKLLVRYCLNANASEAPVAACVLLMQQGAMMPSEIRRLTPERIGLDEKLPILIIDGETKTEARKRVIPIVLGLEFIKTHLPEALEWLNRTTETNHSHRIKHLLIAATGNEALTGHCCRHTFRANSQSADVSPISAATIAGWSGKGAGFSNEMLKYGATGLSQSDVIAGLYRDSKKIHRHLLPAETSNVVSLRTA